jgi:putative aminopeptidase FrvX
MDPIDLLRLLSEAAGPSGREGRVTDLLRSAWSPLCHEFRADRLGNAWALLRADAAERPPAVALVAHADEIGLIVTRIDERGFLRVAALGGVDRRQLLGREVTVHGRVDVAGVVGTKPPHLTPADERRKYPPLHEYWVDVGLSAAAARQRVRVGDPVTLRRPFTPLTGGAFSGKAMDDRAGLAALHAALLHLAERRRRADVLLVATAQEEVGLRGATVAGQTLPLAAAVAVDAGFARQPGVGEGEGMELGRGPVVARGPDVHPRLRDLLLEAARAEAVPVQEEVLAASSGTDAWALQVARSGVPTGLVSIPVRYMHSPVEVVHGDDVRNAGRLLAAAVARVDGAWAEGFTCRLK